jgi:hypothetical protein
MGGSLERRRFPVKALQGSRVRESRQGDSHVPVITTAQYFSRYVYMPKVVDPKVVIDCVRRLDDVLHIDLDGFAYADAYEGDRYVGLTLKAPQEVRSGGLIVDSGAGAETDRNPYTIVRPGWFDYNQPDQRTIVMLQGDKRQAGSPADGVIARDDISRVLIDSLQGDAADHKTLELVAEHGTEQEDLTAAFASLTPDSPGSLDAARDDVDLPVDHEPEISAATWLQSSARTANPAWPSEGLARLDCFQGRQAGQERPRQLNGANGARGSARSAPASYLPRSPKTS